MVYAEAGENFTAAVKRVQNEMKPHEEHLDLNFNDITVRVHRNSNVHDLGTIYDLKHQLVILRVKYMS